MLCILTCTSHLIACSIAPLSCCALMCVVQGIASAPLWDGMGTNVIGVISASDFISILTRLRNSVSSGANPMSEAEMDAHTIRCGARGCRGRDRDGGRGGGRLQPSARLIKSGLWGKQGNGRQRDGQGPICGEVT